MIYDGQNAIRTADLHEPHLFCATAGVAGAGYAISGESTGGVEVYSHGVWRKLAKLNQVRKSATATGFSSDKIFVVGGFDGSIRLRSLEKYDIKNDSWEMMNTTLPHPGTNFVISQISESQILVGGGFNKDTDVFYRKCYKLNVETSELEEAPDLPDQNLTANTTSIYQEEENSAWFMLMKMETDEFWVLNFLGNDWQVQDVFKEPIN